MKRLFESLSGEVLNTKDVFSDDDIEIINNLDNPPPVPVKPEDIYVRKCRLTGDGINCHYGRFHTEDLKILLERVQGVSCLFGHRKETAGVARFFGGEIEKHTAFNPATAQDEEMSFIIPKIYWMKSHSMAEDLRMNIDGGIYHQASISWYFEKPSCGICAKDIRKCDHIPGQRYDGELCFFWYEKLGQVLEGSIVYAGGHPGTGFELNTGDPLKFNENCKVYKVGMDSRIYKDDLEHFITGSNVDGIKLIGEIDEKGWTEDFVELLVDESCSELVSEVFPVHLLGKLELDIRPNINRNELNTQNDILEMFGKGAYIPVELLDDNKKMEISGIKFVEVRTDKITRKYAIRN